jgi:hypothetical protein
LDNAKVRLKYLKDDVGLTWRKIANLDDFKGIPAGTLCSFYKGREPMNPEYRRILGLSEIIHHKARRDPITGRFVKSSPS